MERHRYGRHRAQYGELRLPAGGDGPAPVAVLIHGGFWQAQYDLHLMDDIAEDLVGRGWAAWNLEYRRLGNGGGYPMTFDDVARGTDRLARWGTRIDLRRVVSIGHSAGGHLAAWAAERETPGVRLAGVVAQAGVFDLEPAMGDGAVLELLGGRPDEVPERYAAASPARRLPVGVPLLLTHGADDRAVPPASSVEFAAAARAAGDAVELAVVPGEAHMAHLDPGSGLWRVVVEWLERLPRGGVRPAAENDSRN